MNLMAATPGGNFESAIMSGSSSPGKAESAWEPSATGSRAVILGELEVIDRTWRALGTTYKV